MATEGLKIQKNTRLHFSFSAFFRPATSYLPLQCPAGVAQRVGGLVTPESRVNVDF
jgi:hypothetical protein